MPSTKKGYVNGSDLLLLINGEAVARCTKHTSTFNSETKDRAVKPKQDAAISAGLWKEKGVTGLSISISAEGLRNYDKEGTGFKLLLSYWKSGKPVEVVCIEREAADKPYLKGKFVITKLEESTPAQDDATYSIDLENDGEPEVIDNTAITENEPAAV